MILNTFKGLAKITLSTPFPVGDVNVYLVKGDTLSLIDAGPLTDTAWEQLKRELKTFGYTPDDIEQIILTHHHPDHAGLLDRFTNDITVYGHPYNKHWLDRNERFDTVYKQFYTNRFIEAGIPKKFLTHIPGLRSTLDYMCQRKLDVELTEGEKVPGLEDWRVIETLGHAQSHLSFWREKDGTLLAGDHVLAHISPNPLLEPSFEEGVERTKPLLQYNDSLKKLLDYPISIAYTGHGDEVHDVHSLIPKRLEKQEERAQKVQQFLEGKEMTIFEVCQRLFPSVYKKELVLTLSETLGQLDYLESLNRVSKIERNGIYYYSC
jgi:glyoxylase-like metal-dependent hydrolase (beta-lactamase superfamily II)